MVQEMSFKHILSRALAALLLCPADPFVYFYRGHYCELFSLKYIKFEAVVHEEMAFQDNLC